MNFKVGDIVKTRDGREVEILKVDAPGVQPILGWFTQQEFLGRWCADGVYVFGEDSELDLPPPKRTRDVTVWVNVYEDCEYFHSDEDEARACKDPTALAVAVPATFKLEW